MYVESMKTGVWRYHGNVNLRGKGYVRRNRCWEDDRHKTAYFSKQEEYENPPWQWTCKSIFRVASHYFEESQDSVVSTVTRLRTGWPRQGEEEFSPNRPDGLWGLSSLLFSGHPRPFPGVKRSRRYVDHPPPPKAEVKNEWSYTSTPPIHLHGVDRNNFTLIPFSYTPNLCYCLGVADQTSVDLYKRMGMRRPIVCSVMFSGTFRKGKSSEMNGNRQNAWT
jgi:hypothetical protein